MENNLDQLLGQISNSDSLKKKNAKTYKPTGLKDLLDVLSVGISIHKPDYEIIYANNSICKLYDLKSDDVIGKKCKNVFHDKNRQINDCPIEKSLKTKKQEYSKAYDPKLGKHLEVYTIPLLDDKKKVTSILHIVKDITNLENFKELLEDTKKRMYNLFENSNDAIFLITINGRITDLNKKACDITGQKKEKLLKMNFSELFAPDESSKIEKRILGGNYSSSNRFESIIARPDGNSIFVDISSSLIDEQEEIIQAIVRDISDQKRIENELIDRGHVLEQKTTELEKSQDMLIRQQDQLIQMQSEIEDANIKLEEKVKKRTKEVEEEKNKVQELLNTKILFINQLSHDLRTPLTPLTTLLPIIEKHVHGEDKHRLQIVISNVKYMRELVVDTLNLARLDSESLIFNFQKVDISSMVDNIIIDNSSTLEKTGLKAKNHITESTYVKIDELRIKEVITNLIGNSIKYCPDGGKLTFNAIIHPKFVELSVSDTGIGVESNKLENLFQEFYRADESRHSISSGLGLAICKKIIEKHDGKIWAESEGLEKGTTIKFTLPRRVDDQEEAEKDLDKSL